MSLELSGTNVNNVFRTQPLIIIVSLSASNLPRPHQRIPTSLDLPDYFSVVQNIDEVCSSVNTAEVSSENVPETPPPSYEEATGITTLALSTAVINQVGTLSSIQYAFTQETMAISDEIFV